MAPFAPLVACVNRVNVSPVRAVLPAQQVQRVTLAQQATPSEGSPARVALRQVRAVAAVAVGPQQGRGAAVRGVARRSRRMQRAKTFILRVAGAGLFQMIGLCDHRRHFCWLVLSPWACADAKWAR